MIRRRVECDIDVRQLAHDPRQPFDRKGDCTRFLYLRLDFAANAQIEIGRRQRNLIFLRLNQHVAQNGHGRLGADHVEDLCEAIGEVIAVDFKFHCWAIDEDWRS